MPDSVLHQAFLADHQALMQGLAHLRECVAAGDVRQALALAEEIDRSAGPHIAFEEQCLLPAMEREFGAKFVAHLSGEHAVGQAAIGALRHHPPGNPFTPERKHAIVQQIDAALDHAFSIGTLLSHLDTLPRASQAGLQQCVESQRRRGPRWTELGIGAHG